MEQLPCPVRAQKMNTGSQRTGEGAIAQEGMCACETLYFPEVASMASARVTELSSNQQCNVWKPYPVSFASAEGSSRLQREFLIWTVSV